MRSKTITFILNGERRSVDVEPADLLLDVLRDRLGVTGPKYSCGRGDCGTCTVLLNGRTVRSCLMLAVEVEGQRVDTVEGLSRGRLTPLQKSFIEHNSFQCGFCAPGMIATATELLKKNPKPTRHEVQEAISGNLCRCTGYEPTIDAILAVAKKN
jgi:carbon-monoxide dehydrogenase small subunit